MVVVLLEKVRHVVGHSHIDIIVVTGHPPLLPSLAKGQVRNWGESARVNLLQALDELVHGRSALQGVDAGSVRSFLRSCGTTGITTITIALVATIRTGAGV